MKWNSTSVLQKKRKAEDFEAVAVVLLPAIGCWHRSPPNYVNRARMILLSPHFTPAMIEHGGSREGFFAGLLVVAHLLITNRELALVLSVGLPLCVESRYPGPFLGTQLACGLNPCWHGKYWYLLVLPSCAALWTLVVATFVVFWSPFFPSPCLHKS